LTPTLFPCYAAPDRELAASLAAFLELGVDLNVFFGEGEMRPGEDLAAKAREARMADIVVPLLSRNSVPVPWPRAQWEGALIDEPKAEGVHIGFVRCDEYVPPRVLAPQFDGRSLVGWRELKRWVRNRVASYIPPETPPCPELSVDLETLSAALADRPGSATVASANLAFEFAGVTSADFDEILRLECGDQTLAALAGDLAVQLGLRLEGELESNLVRLRDFCSARRFLLLLDGVRSSAAAHEFVFGGKCSTLLCTESGPRGGASGDDPLQTAQRVLLDAKTGFEEVCQFARAGRRLLRDQGRIAELYELMQQWHAAAEARGDLRILDESSRELVWILEGWGRYDEARRLEYHRVAEYGEQMLLPLGDL
jgi:hypothetical protein